MSTDTAALPTVDLIRDLMVRAGDAATLADAASERYDEVKARLAAINGRMADFEAGRSPELADAGNQWRYWTALATRLNTELTWRLLWRQITGGHDA